MKRISKKQKDTIQRISEAGFGHVLDGLGFARLLSRRSQMRATETIDERTIARLLTELGPGFVELARIIAPRSDIVPTRLQNMLLNVSYQPDRRRTALRSVQLKRTFGSAAKEIRHIEAVSEPGTVVAHRYHAILEDGRRAVVLMHDHRAIGQLDHNAEQIRWMLDVALKHIDRTRAALWESIWEEFHTRYQSLRTASLAGSHMQLLREQFSDQDKIEVPKVYWRLTNESILTYERVMHPSFIDVAEGRHQQTIIKKYVGRYLFDAAVRQWGQYGHFLLRPRGSQLCIGQRNKIYYAHPLPVAQVPSGERTRLALCMYALLKGDAGIAAKALLSCSYERQQGDDRLRAGFYPYKHTPGTASEIWWNFLEHAWSGNVSVPLSFSMAAESLTYLERAVHGLDEEIEVHDGLRVAFQKNASELFGVKKQASLKEIASAVLIRSGVS